ncbi:MULTISPECIES: xanthine dehydrogenase subunit C [Shouchella]|jgi:xanthine dehydrogenase C subunit|uniref:Xanthine dehydrogenase subunit C n=2 Tax=Shouchella TaxID=2893057 RepID=A0A268NZQ4_SHOCL|nr:xanthine dehydrogenase subunit C [Shouchella clausii]PAE88982.1 xanthine dehydrogenase subunit C [Shouchella clausii]
MGLPPFAEVEMNQYPPVSMPTTVEQAWAEAQKPGSTFVAGGTIVQMRREQGFDMGNRFVSLEQIRRLKTMIETDTAIYIGAFATLAECLNSKMVAQEQPLLVQALASIGAPAVRNRATLGGNIVYGKGDSIPALLVLEANVVLYHDGLATMPLSEWLQQKPNALLTEVEIGKWPDMTQRFWLYEKVGRRETFTASLVTVAGVAVLDNDQTIKELKLAVGGGEMVPHRLLEMEQRLIGKPLTNELLADVYQFIKQTGTLVGTPFATETYLRMVLANQIVSFVDGLRGGRGDGKTNDSL